MAILLINQKEQKKEEQGSKIGKIRIDIYFLTVSFLSFPWEWESILSYHCNRPPYKTTYTASIYQTPKNILKNIPKKEEFLKIY